MFSAIKYQILGIADKRYYLLAEIMCQINYGLLIKFQFNATEYVNSHMSKYQMCAIHMYFWCFMISNSFEWFIRLFICIGSPTLAILVKQR